jgi:hypothetical protein
MKLALCTTCKGRLTHLKETLPANLADNAGMAPERSVFVLLDYNSKDGLGDWVKSEMADHLKSGRLVYYRYTSPGPFKMAHAKNLAHRLGILEGATHIVNVDADNFIGAGFAAYVLDHFQAHGSETFLWSRMVKGEMARGISGRIAVTREQFILVGGYNEKYKTWSPDDTDFKLRLRRLGHGPVEVDPRFLDALNHNDRVRFREYPQAALVESNGDSAYHDLEKETSTVANFGDFGRGVVYRNFDASRPVEVGLLPTRIFGIGMHKTGTTSLSKALHRLGYSCAHWPSAHWAKKVYTDMTTAGRSVALEKTMAACDLPIGILFREIDAAYPGSKFILTIRNVEDWLRSCEKHFSPANPFYETWNTDPFSHKLHKLVYGRAKYDREVFLGRYYQHNAEVREYFRGRPDDLLEFEVGAAGWHELCGFLRLSVPDRPFPWENKCEPAEVANPT